MKKREGLTEQLKKMSLEEIQTELEKVWKQLPFGYAQLRISEMAAGYEYGFRSAITRELNEWRRTQNTQGVYPSQEQWEARKSNLLQQTSPFSADNFVKTLQYQLQNDEPNLLQENTFPLEGTPEYKKIYSICDMVSQLFAEIARRNPGKNIYNLIR